MIAATFSKKSDNLISVMIRGHAESVGQGYDMVCSAVSAVSQSILIGITEVLKLNVKYSLEKGFLSFSLDNISENDVLKCQVLMKTMLLGLKSIEISFGEYISVEEIEEV